MDKSKLSFGEELVGIEFNPSNDGAVAEIKEAAAAFANVLEKYSRTIGRDNLPSRFIDESVTYLVVAQMLAVKAVTWGK